MLVDEGHGGGSVTDQPLVDLAALAEELGRQLYPGPVLPTNVVADAIGRAGSEDQRGQHLGPIAGGDSVATWCLSGDGTTEVGAVEVRLTPSGTGTVRLDGVARFVHDAHVSDLLLVTVVGDAGLSLVIVPADTAGLSCRLLRTIDLTRRFAEVRFDGVEVDTATIVGEPGGAGPLVERALQVATVLQSAEAVGAAEQLFERTVQYAKDRVQFGRTIGGFQSVKHRLADLLVQLEAARAAARYAALAVADDRPDRDEAVAVAGSFVRDACAYIGGEALQIHGGIGFTWDHDVHLFVRRAKADQALYGEPSWHRERLTSIMEREVKI
jgi:alkylation response protein AidB-like acyl-CoA dehydrogenase